MIRKLKTQGLRVAIYARRTVDSEKSDSIQMQIDVCKKHLELARPGQVESIEIFQDEGFTRRNTDRPDWERMMQCVEDGLLDLIIAYKIDRISGNMRDFALFYTKVVDEYDMQLISVREGVDSSLPLVGEAMAYICAMMATYEVKQDSIRSYDNSRNLAVHGFWTGGLPPLGYARVPVTVGGKVHKILEPVPEDVAYKENLVNIFLENGFSLSKMEGYLKRNGIKTRYGKFFSTTRIYSILTAPQCVENTPEIYDYFAAMGCQMEQSWSSRDKWDGQHGIIVFGRTTEQKGKHVNNPPEDWLVCIGKHKPTMSAETYLRIRKQLAQNTFQKTTKYAPELLKGIVRCNCGSLMRVSRKKKVDGSYSSWYYCLKRMRQGAEYCDAHHTKTEILDEQVLKLFHDIQADPDVINKYLVKTDKKSKYPSVSKLRKQERNLEDKLQRLASTLALNSESTAAKYVIEEMERLDAELVQCRRTIALASSEARIVAREKKNQADKRMEICEMINGFDEFTKEEQNKVAKAVLKECVWDGETLKITL